MTLWTLDHTCFAFADIRTQTTYVYADFLRLLVSEALQRSLSH